MGTQNTGQYTVLDNMNVDGAFRNALRPEGTWAFDAAYYNADSNSATEVYAMLGQLPAMRKSDGGLVFKELDKYSLSIPNEDYDASIQMRLADLRRDKTGQLLQRIQQLGIRARTHWNKLAADLITNGTTDLSFDGVAFYSASHAFGSNTYSNLLTSSDYSALNVVTATAPTADEAADALVYLTGHFDTYVDEAGEPIWEDDATYQILCGTAAMKAAFEIALTSDTLTSGTTNPARGLRDRVRLIYTPRLSSLTTQIVINRISGDPIMRPFVLQQEVAPELKQPAENDSAVITSGKTFVAATTTRGAGYGFPTESIHATFS